MLRVARPPAVGPQIGYTPSKLRAHRRLGGARRIEEHPGHHTGGASASRRIGVRTGNAPVERNNSARPAEPDMCALVSARADRP